MSNNSTKIALVTGGNRGIGFAICQGLLEAGFQVILTARSLDKAKTAIEKLDSKKVYPLVLDIDDDDSISKAFKEVSKHFSYLNVLINNAGIYPDKEVNILNITRDLLTKTMNTNAFGAIKMVQTFLPLLNAATNAKVINMSSGLGEIGSQTSNIPSYCLSKLTLNASTIMLSEALRAKNIAVYAMCPGWVKTDMGGDSAPKSPQQGADTAIWLATEASLSLSGKFFRNRREISY